MLLRLKIENIGVFSDSEINFSKKLNIITGESGSGKTMFLKSLGLALGEKPDLDLIGPAGEDAYVEAEFKTAQTPPAISDLVSETDFVLARRMKAGSPTKAFVSGRFASSEQLLKATEDIITRSDQHASIKLKNIDRQLEIIDSLVSDTLKNNIKNSFHKWQKSRKELAELRNFVLDKENEVELIRSDIDLWDSVLPIPGELDQLQQELSLISSGQKTIEYLANAYNNIQKEGGASDLLGEAESLILNIQGSKEMSDLGERIASLLAEAQEVAVDINDFIENIDFSSERMAEIESRISDISDLKRRFKNAEIKDIEKRIIDLRKQINVLEGSDQTLLVLEQETEKLKKDYLNLSGKLTKKRKESAERISSLATGYLKDLNLESAQIEFAFKDKDPSDKGSDRVELFFKPNKNLKKAPVGAGASGGELSRLNIAIALALSESGSSDLVYVFDEIDAGISGETAHKVGNLLARLAEKNQVIAITHLVQIAIHGQSHFLITKNDQGATIKKLDQTETDQELSRLIGLEDSDRQSIGLVKKAAGIK